MKYIDTNRGYITPSDLIRLEKWESRYIELVDYHKQFGHCLINYKTHRSLANWATRQRNRKKNGKLSAQEEDLLNELNFVWQLKKTIPRSQQVTWDKRLESFRLFKKKNPTLSNEELILQMKKNEKKLYHLICYKSYDYHLKKISKENIVQLTRLFGNAWIRERKDKILKNWIEYYEELKSFYIEHKHCNVEEVYDYNHEFSSWVRHQVILYKKGFIVEEKKVLLDRLGFEGIIKKYKLDNNDQWVNFYQQLVDYKKKHGHVNVKSKEKLSLYRWLYRQKLYKDKLTQEKVELLEKVGVKWDAKTKVQNAEFLIYWNARFEEYEKLVLEGKKDQISYASPLGSEGKRLSNWEIKQRLRYKSGYLFTKDQIQKMKAVGILDGLDEPLMNNHVLLTHSEDVTITNHWMERYQELVLYKKNHGHTLIKAKENPSLRQWIEAQIKRKENLTAEQIRLLEDLGINWDAIKTKSFNQFIIRWYVCYHQYENYLKEGRVKEIKNSAPKGSLEKKIYTWVTAQRSKYDNDHIFTADQIQKLIKINIIDDPKEKTIPQNWMMQYQSLVEYREKHGDINNIERENIRLRKWVKSQINKKNFLSEKQVQLLDTIGLDWNQNLNFKGVKRGSEWYDYIHTYEKYVIEGKADIIKRTSPRYSTEEKLYNWKRIQRRRFNKEYPFTEDQIKKMKELGILDDLKEKARATSLSKWMIKYEELVAFKKKYGHTDIPTHISHTLRQWVRNQVEGKIKLSSEQIDLLDKIGFEWKLNTPSRHSKKGSLWYIKLNEYENYVKDGKANNICYGASEGSVGNKLYLWRKGQRIRYNKGFPFTEEQIKRMKEIGILDK